MDIKINKPKWSAEGFHDMLFTADYMNTIYDCCHNYCDNCILGTPILNDTTTPCMLITKTKMRLLKEIKDQL